MSVTKPLWRLGTHLGSARLRLLAARRRNRIVSAHALVYRTFIPVVADLSIFAIRRVHVALRNPPLDVPVTFTSSQITSFRFPQGFHQTRLEGCSLIDEFSDGRRRFRYSRRSSDARREREREREQICIFENVDDGRIRVAHLRRAQEGPLCRDRSFPIRGTIARGIGRSEITKAAGNLLQTNAIVWRRCLCCRGSVSAIETPGLPRHPLVRICIARHCNRGDRT